MQQPEQQKDRAAVAHREPEAETTVAVKDAGATVAAGKRPFPLFSIPLDFFFYHGFTDCVFTGAFLAYLIHYICFFRLLPCRSAALGGWFLPLCFLHAVQLGVEMKSLLLFNVFLSYPYSPGMPHPDGLKLNAANMARVAREHAAGGRPNGAAQARFWTRHARWTIVQAKLARDHYQLLPVVLPSQAVRLFLSQLSVCAAVVALEWFLYTTGRVGGVDAAVATTVVAAVHLTAFSVLLLLRPTSEEWPPQPVPDPPSPSLWALTAVPPAVQAFVRGTTAMSLLHGLSTAALLALPWQPWRHPASLLLVLPLCGSSVGLFVAHLFAMELEGVALHLARCRRQRVLVPQEPVLTAAWCAAQPAHASWEHSYASFVWWYRHAWTAAVGLLAVSAVGVVAALCVEPVWAAATVPLALLLVSQAATVVVVGWLVAQWAVAKREVDGEEEKVVVEAVAVAVEVDEEKKQEKLAPLEKK